MGRTMTGDKLSELFEKAMGTGLAGTESVNYTVSDEDMLRRLYGL